MIRYSDDSKETNRSDDSIVYPDALVRYPDEYKEEK